MKIGVAGLNAAGKGEVVRLLERRSFYPVSLSDVIRQDLARDGLEPTRENMIERGRALRERFGQSVLAERVQRGLGNDRNHVIDSIRHPAEVEALRAGGDFLLLWVEASPAGALRALARARPRRRRRDLRGVPGARGARARPAATGRRSSCSPCASSRISKCRTTATSRSSRRASRRSCAIGCFFASGRAGTTTS